jgi:hypothetical protein
MSASIRIQPSRGPIPSLRLGRCAAALLHLSCLAVTSAGLAVDLRAQSSPAPSDATTGAPTPAPLSRYLDATRLRAGSDSFVVLLQGVARGWQRHGVMRDGTDWIVTDAIAMPPMGSQESRVRLDASLDERSIRQEGQMRGMPMRIALDFTDGAVKGTALTPSHPAGPLDITSSVPKGTLDDNAVVPLLAGLRWRGDLDIAFPVLLSGKGTVVTWRLRVLAPDTTTVPAGRFDTWRAELATGEAPVVLYFERAAPHRLVRMQYGGGAFDVQRAR